MDYCFFQSAISWGYFLFATPALSMGQHPPPLPHVRFFSWAIGTEPAPNPFWVTTCIMILRIANLAALPRWAKRDGALHDNVPLHLHFRSPRHGSDWHAGSRWYGLEWVAGCSSWKPVALFIYSRVVFFLLSIFLSRCFWAELFLVGARLHHSWWKRELIVICFFLSALWDLHQHHN